MIQQPHTLLLFFFFFDYSGLFVCSQLIPTRFSAEILQPPTAARLPLPSTLLTRPTLAGAGGVCKRDEDGAEVDLKKKTRKKKLLRLLRTTFCDAYCISQLGNGCILGEACSCFRHQVSSTDVQSLRFSYCRLRGPNFCSPIRIVSRRLFLFFSLYDNRWTPCWCRSALSLREQVGGYVIQNRNRSARSGRQHCTTPYTFLSGLKDAWAVIQRVMARRSRRRVSP
jgi:hypothetical protein